MTDAISPLGLEDGEHYIGQLRVNIENGTAKIAGTDTLCGCIASMDECVRIFKQSTGEYLLFYICFLESFFIPVYASKVIASFCNKINSS